MTMLHREKERGLAVERWVSPAVRTLRAYHVPQPDKLVKLDAMESPYQISDELKEQWSETLKSVAVNRYPDAQCGQLKSALRTVFGIPDHLAILVGNGSDELIQIICLLVGGKGRIIMAPVPTFSMYQILSTITHSQFIGVPLNADFSLNKETLLLAITKHDPACLFFSYPNNPTGNLFDAHLIEETLKLSTGLVVVDEAYFAFCQQTCIRYTAQYPNLVILRTMSKSGMAGLRLGMLLGHSQWVTEMEKLRLPYNIDSLTQASGFFYLQHYPVLEGYAELVLQERQWLEKEMTAIEELHIFDSEANFILFRIATDAVCFFETLKEKGVLIRNLHQPGGTLENCFRVTVGTRQENQLFITATKDVISDIRAHVSS